LSVNCFWDRWSCAWYFWTWRNHCMSLNFLKMLKI